MVRAIPVDGRSVTVNNRAVTYGSAIPDSGIAKWTFDSDNTSGSTATDIWNGNNGSINGATTGVSGANQTYNSNEAYEFDGSDDKVTVSSFPSYGPTFSIAFWYKGNSSSSDEAFWQSDQNRNGIGANRLAIASRGDKFIIKGYDGGAAGKTEFFNDEVIRDGSWHHVCVTSDASSQDNADLVAYVDGSSQASISSVSTINTTESHTAYIASDQDNSGYLDGRLDDFRIYSKALNATEVSNLYSTGKING